MDLRIVQMHLAEAERHVALGERHIAQQLEMIERLERAGHDTRLALDLLVTYQRVQESHIQHRALIQQELSVLPRRALQNVP